MSMLTIQNATFIATFITYIIAYFITIPFGGFFRAWTAKKLGDNTGEDLGYLTLNPLAHFDTTGFVMLFLSYIFFNNFFGWGAFVPVNPFNFVGRFKRIKLFIASIADVIGYLVGALLCIIILCVLFDPTIGIIIYKSIMQHGNVDHTFLLKIYPQHSQFVVITAMILIATTVLSVILALVYLIRNVFMLIPLLRIQNNSYESDINFFNSFLLPSLAIIFLLPLMLTITAQTLITAGIVIARIITSVIGHFIGS